MVSEDQPNFASRAGAKLAHGLDVFRVSPAGRVCADLGSHTGGFVDCLLRRGAKRVYAIERGYGLLLYRLREDSRVRVMERTDALHVRLPEAVDLVTIDTGWTRQRLILPVAGRWLTEGGEIVSLVKPQYEAEPSVLRRGVVPPQRLEDVLSAVRAELIALGVRLVGETESPICGHGGNREFLWHLVREPQGRRSENGTTRSGA